MAHQPLILASQSPRRSQLLREAGIPFEVVEPRYVEPEPETWEFSALELAEAASYFKARSVAQGYPDRIVLGADTVVALGDQLFGKAQTAADARRILSTLSGTTHEVITGVTLYTSKRHRRLIRHAVTRIHMRRMTDAELDDYVASNEWQGKAGAYGIQDTGDRFIERIEGSFSNVVGLPVELVQEMLDTFRKCE